MRAATLTGGVSMGVVQMDAEPAESAGGPAGAAAAAHAWLLAACFSGLLSNQLIPHKDKCTHRSGRTEPFYKLSLEFKHKRMLEDSLRTFVEGERLDGANAYNCDTRHRGGTTLKRACLAH